MVHPSSLKPTGSIAHGERWRLAAKIEDVLFEGELLVVRVVPIRRAGPRCGLCRRICPRYDGPRGRRRWRALDLGTARTFIEAEVARVSCPEHEVVIERVPWAVHGSGFTRATEDQVAWLAVECSKTAVAALMRIAWRTVGRILERVVRQLLRPKRQLAGLRRIGIDEISFRKGQRYLTIVVDHESGRLVWAAEGRDELTLSRFFKELGWRRCRPITQVSADGAWWINNIVRFYCPQAVSGSTPSTPWPGPPRPWMRSAASSGTSPARRRTRPRPSPQAHPLRGLEERREPDREPAEEAGLARADQPAALPRLPAEGEPAPGLPVAVPRGGGAAGAVDAVGLVLPHRGLRSPRRHHRQPPRRHPHHGRTPPLVALVEAVNTRIRLLTRRAFGFHSSKPLIALAMLSFSGYRPALPGVPPDAQICHKSPYWRPSTARCKRQSDALGATGRTSTTSP